MTSEDSDQFFSDMAEAELFALRASFHNQSVLLKRLQAELEEERNAAASGVEEALSMIMRLQEEKAAQSMEACQYKRVAEEKLEHAEESIAFLNEVIFQKGLENASLKFQVQNYKQKLLALGIKDCDFERITLNARPRLKKSSTFSMKKRLDRNISMPAIRLEEIIAEIDGADKYCSLHPDRQVSPLEIAECPKQILDDYYASEPHMESVGMMQEYDTSKVHFLKEFRQEPVYANRTLKRLLTPRRYKENDFTKCEDILSTETMNLEVEYDCSWNQGGDYSGKSMFLPKINEEYPENESNFTSLSRRVPQARSYARGIGIQNIYEIQESQNGDDLCGTYNKLPQDPLPRAESINKDLCSLQGPSIHASSYQNKSTKEHEDGPLTTQGCSNRDVPCPTDIEQLKERMQRLEDSVRSIKEGCHGRGKDPSELFKRVVEQLDSIGTFFKIAMQKFDCHQDNDCLLPLAEAMQCFWI